MNADETARALSQMEARAVEAEAEVFSLQLMPP
jgi:hypothetical protein